ncbi:MAG: PAS domain S-box protein [Myxococcales bacterium]|jgi:PAS domain S-box-containing protein
MKRDRTSKADLLSETERLRARAAELECAIAELTRRLERAALYSRTLLDSAPVAVMISDLDGVIVDANDAALAASGLASREAIIGRSIFDLVPANDRSFARQVFAQMLDKAPDPAAGGGPVAASHLASRVELTAQMLRDSEGKPLAMMVTSLDAAGKRRLAEAEKLRIAALRALNSLAIDLAAVPLGADIFEVVAEKTLETCGATAVATLAFDAKRRELALRHVAIAESAPEEGRTLLASAIAGLRMPVSDEKIERMLRHVVNAPADLTELTFNALPAPVAEAITAKLDLGELRGLALHHGGDLFGTVGLLMPRGHAALPPEALHALANMVSVAVRRVMAEEALGESNERFALFMEHLPSFAFIKDAEQRLVFANSKLAEVVGRSIDELLGRRPEEIWPPELAARVCREDAEILQHGRAIAGVETRLGDRLYASYKFRIGRGTHPPLIGGFAVDITENKRAEEERRKLEARVLQTQKLESLCVLAGGIAHDFNNLLTGILGNASLALSDLGAESPLREGLQQVIASARCAAELTRQMLAFAGKGSFLTEPISLSEVIAQMAPLLEISVSKASVIKYELERDLPPIEADVSQLRQLLMNLVTNASEAIGDQAGLITVSTSRLYCQRTFLDQTQHEGDLPEGTYVCLTVSDTGAGMTDEVLPKIYEPFFTTKFTGRGLGLAATLGIVRAHRGGIHTTSQLGRGTVVRVLLPPCGGAASAQASRPTALSDWRASGTVLVADDEDFVRLSAVRILKRAGLDAVTANDGIEAVEVVRKLQGRLRLVLLDASMPKMDGIEALHEIRRICPDLPIVLSSGYSEQEVTEEIGTGTIAGFVQKPYGVDDLLSVVRKVLDARREPRSPRARDRPVGRLWP